eukprot:200922-Pleurochrysis_carterae.AAC.2
MTLRTRRPRRWLAAASRSSTSLSERNSDTYAIGAPLSWPPRGRAQPLDPSLKPVENVMELTSIDTEDFKGATHDRGRR